MSGHKIRILNMIETLSSVVAYLIIAAAFMLLVESIWYDLHRNT